jgi:large subunit ribosomal protein L25
MESSMSEVSSFDAVARPQAGKGEARATRRSGLVPAVIYGNKQSSVNIALDPRIIIAEMNKPGFYSRLFDIKVEGKVERCLCRDIQRHPVTDAALHVDFLRISADSKVHVHVPVHFANQDKSPGLKRGGVLNIVSHEVEIVAPGNAIPDEVVVDLSGLEIGASVHIDSLKLPAGVTVVTHHKDVTLATIAAPTVALAGDAAAEAPTA